MAHSGDANALIGRVAVDAEGDRVGEIDQVYLDHGSDRPLWVTVATGLLGMRSKFAPVHGYRLDDEGRVGLPVPHDLIKAAPDVEDDTRMTAAEQEDLFRHYAGFVGPTAPVEPGPQ